MKKVFKVISLLFIMILAVPLFVACGETPPPDGDDGGLTPPPASPTGISYLFVPEEDSEDEGAHYIVSGIGDCSDKDIVIKSSIYNEDLGETFPVTKIGGNAFWRCDGIETVVLPDTITKIENSAFEECANLRAINIPNSLTSIGFYSFYKCESLQSITLGQSVSIVKACAFEDCVSLKTATILSPSVTMGDGVFSGCINLEEIVGSEAIRTIGDYAFCGCDNLKSFTFNNSIISIGDYAFSGCDNIESIVVPDSVKIIGDEAFSDCDKLVSVKLGKSITSIGKCIFSWSAILAKDEYWINNAFYLDNYLIYAEGCSGVYTIKEGTKCIANYAFFNNENEFTELIIPDSVKYIGERAFGYCRQLEKVVIGEFVEFIGEKAFEECSSLEIAIFEDSEDWKANNDDIDSEMLGNNGYAADYLTSQYVNYSWRKLLVA